MVTLEVGAGTGTATRQLLELGANPLVAVDPDERLAAFLRETIPEKALSVIVEPFGKRCWNKAASTWGSAPLCSIS